MNAAGKPEDAPRTLDIGICTYRRPALETLLESVRALVPPDDIEIGVIVADNDDRPSARALVDKAAAEFPFPIRYVHCPASNISLARNACLHNSAADFLAFVDDDEIVSPDWLCALLAEADRTGTDAVLGPVRSVYPDDAGNWMRRGDFHSTLPVWARGEIRTGYTCNVLLRMASPHLSGRRFDIALGRSGGEDTDYFSRLHRAGGAIAFAPDAVVWEPVTRDRMRFAWLARRRFRMGQTHGRLVGEGRGLAGRFLQIGLASAKMAYCLGATAFCAASPVLRNRSLLRLIMHAGAVGGLTGIGEIHLYGEEPGKKVAGNAS
jgi:succinoglycan biosynthesis protein ExoM